MGCAHSCARRVKSGSFIVTVYIERYPLVHYLIDRYDLANMSKSWDSSENWYSSCVGEKGHYYHQTVVLPNVLRMLGKFHSLLDLGCGQGVLARHLKES